MIALKFTPTALPRQARGYPNKAHLDFKRIAGVALANAPAILKRWLPDGAIETREYVARNPRRLDRHPGSFKVNLATGEWSDFATGDAGGDLISLAAYLHGVNNGKAARLLAQMLGIEHD